MHLGKKEEALEVCIQALLEEEVGGGTRITMMKRCQRVYYQLKNEKQKIEKAEKKKLDKAEKKKEIEKKKKSCEIEETRSKGAY